jgi:hypothetical protein
LGAFEISRAAEVFLTNINNRLEWLAIVRNATRRRRNFMQAPIQPIAASGQNQNISIAVAFEETKWQRPEFIELKSAGVASEDISNIKRSVLYERGVPFSPLND